MKTYIQIGSNKGNDDFFRKMCKLNDFSKIILIEANKFLIYNLNFCYNELKKKHEIKILNKGIVHDTSLNKLILYGKHDGLSSIFVRKSYPHNTGFVKFEAITFNKLCQQEKISEIEELQIDTEGYDYQILNSIDFSNIKIKNINCEVWPYDCDSTANIETGPKFFENVIRPKMEKFYELKYSNIDQMKSHIFKLK